MVFGIPILLELDSYRTAPNLNLLLAGVFRLQVCLERIERLDRRFFASPMLLLAEHEHHVDIFERLRLCMPPIRPGEEIGSHLESGADTPSQIVLPASGILLLRGAELEPPAKLFERVPGR